MILRSRKTKKTPGTEIHRAFAEALAEWTGLEPATPDVTGRYSNQLNYHSVRICFVSSELSFEGESHYTESLFVCKCLFQGALQKNFRICSTGRHSTENRGFAKG